MLPSTGHFREVNCPFLESGLCERPYCHFRHARRAEAPQLLHRLVAEAVKKVLDKRPTDDGKALVDDVVRELAPQPVTYKPTPIADLKPHKRHIPVPYTPHRPTRVQPYAPQYATSYTPTPLAPRPQPAFSSDDDDNLDDMEAEFETLGQILDEETTPKDDTVEAAPVNGHKRKRSRNRRRERKRKKSTEPVVKEEKEKEIKQKDKPVVKEEKEKEIKQKDKPVDREKSSNRSKVTKSSHRDKSKKSSPSKTSPDKRKSSKPPPEKVEKVVELNFSVDDDDMMEIFSSDSDEESRTQECMRIFEEYVPVRKEIQKETPKKDEDNSSEATGRKRVAHATEQSIVRSTPTIALPDHKTKAVLAMADRPTQIRQFHEARSTVVEVNARPAAVSSSKFRIAHVPYVSSMLEAKKALPKQNEPPKLTVTQTATKGAGRVAHVPNEKFCDRPSVLEPLSSRVPVNIRTKFLNMMIDECLKIYLSAEDAYARALQEELATSKKCKAISIYNNSALLTVTRLRREIKEADGVKKSALPRDVISHGPLVDGRLKSSWSIESKYKIDNRHCDEFKGVKFYKNILRWAMSDQDLQDNGFPRPHPDGEKGKAKIYTKNTRQRPPKGNLRTCARCKKEFLVDKRGFSIIKQECIYHPNNKYRFRGEVKYQCCSQDGASDGCLSASCHVYEYVDHDNLRGYVRTMPRDPEEPDDYNVYALDCEMCYTTNGLDLTRVTVIDSSCNVIYETLVKPPFPIVDYNTRYSGLTEESMSGCTTTLVEVQATFLHMFSDRTILVGHSLESDFKALKFIHDTVVDTSVLFPHKMGPPYKRALRNLSSEYLKKIIQNSVDGHDSAEDATVCMELIIWKLKEELKIR